MLWEDFFVNCDYPAYVDPTPTTAESLAIALHGKVIFDLGHVTHPSFGTVNIKGEFPRIKPRYARDEVSSKECEELKARLRTWIDIHFNRNSNPEYFEGLIQASSLGTVFVNPFHDIDTNDMLLANKIIFWLWLNDDAIEAAIQKNIPFNIVDEALDQFIGALRGNTKTFVEVKGCPGFRPLFNAILDIHESAKEHADGFENLMGSFIFMLKRYFDALRWYAVERIEGPYSEETFRFWRRIDCFMDGVGDILFMLQRLELPRKILRSPSLRRILDIVTFVCSSTNDLLGLAKELKCNQTGNIIVFKVLQKGIPVEQAVAEVCAAIKSELTDYLMLRDALLYEFHHDPVLVKYIDVLESMIDGHNKIYGQSPRHLSVGKVTLTR